MEADAVNGDTALFGDMTDSGDMLGLGSKLTGKGHAASTVVHGDADEGAALVASELIQLLQRIHDGHRGAEILRALKVALRFTGIRIDDAARVGAHILHTHELALGGTVKVDTGLIEGAQDRGIRVTLDCVKRSDRRELVPPKVELADQRHRGHHVEGALGFAGIARKDAAKFFQCELDTYI